MDSAIGAPPPEQMAALVNMDSKLDNSSEYNKDTKTGENQSKSGFGFGLFDYTLNTLESIGKKTIEVIKVDERHNPTKPQSRDKMD